VKPVTPPAPAAAKKEAAVPAKKDEPTSSKAVEPKPVTQKKEAPTAAKAPAAAAKKPAVKKKPESYVIFVGEFPAGEEAAAAGEKLVRLGVKPVVRQELKKNRNMHRLYSGVYTDYDAYSAALDKLKQAAKGAFGVEKDGKYSLYAGSFSTKERAEKEQRDLFAKGVTLQVQQVALSLATVRITAGQFSARADADRAAAKMKGEGLVVKVVPKGR
jgi:cell division protein FtsN